MVNEKCSKVNDIDTSFVDFVRLHIVPSRKWEMCQCLRDEDDDDDDDDEMGKWEMGR